MCSSIGNTIKQLMKRKGVSNSEVISALGITAKSFEAYIADQREPRDEVKEKLSKYFNVSASMFVIEKR